MINMFGVSKMLKNRLGKTSFIRMTVRSDHLAFIVGAYIYNAPGGNAIENNRKFIMSYDFLDNASSEEQQVGFLSNFDKCVKELQYLVEETAGEG